ncbi:MAG: hemolysin family protein [Nanoarchaeota archaeon]|nr:hemolysin family protein [Nanoarchaeota archaeon]
MDPITLFILTILVMLLLSALVSGSEAALLSVSLAKAKEIKNSSDKTISQKGKVLLMVKENLQQHITTIVVLNNIINIVGSIYVGVLATEIFGDTALGIVSAVLTFLIILFSEIIPKIYGEQYCDTISTKIAIPLFFLSKILFPITWFLSKLTNIFVKQNSNHSVSEGEIKEMAALGKLEGSIESFESDIIENVFKMNDIQVYDVMVPFSKVISFQKNSSFDDVVKTVEKTGFTRFPILKGNEVIGLINVKDLFKFHNRQKDFDISKIIRPIIFVPETMKLSTLEKKLKKARIHMAVIVNEHGDFTGIITLEDIIEEILGDIIDEYDLDVEEEIKEIRENTFHIKASIEISELNSKLNLSLPEDDEYSTLNGYMIIKTDSIPKTNQTLSIDQGTFRVIKRSKKKVIEVEFIRYEETDSSDEY